MVEPRTDESILKHIHALVEHEHHLTNQTDLSEADRERLRALEVELDQCWDLLR